MSDLLEKQQKFVQCLGELIGFCYSHGWALTLGEGFIGDSIDRPWEDSPHMRHGNHFRRLAQDLNLFVDGQYVVGEHPAWDELGAFWKGLDPNCKWGGDFSHKDYNHFSMAHAGVA